MSDSLKNELRQQQKARLRALGPLEREQQEVKLCQNLRQLWLASQRPWVLGFASLGEEPNLEEFWGLVLRQGRLALPRVSGVNLIFHEVTRWSQLNRVPPWGIREPLPESSLWPPGEVPRSLVLVPGLAFDRHGGRLGRGKGFYDRFLASLLPGVLAWGVGWQESLVEEVPREAHDIRLNGWVGPEGLNPLAL